MPPCMTGNREYGAVADMPPQFVLGIVEVDELDLGARRHDSADAAVAEPQRHLDDRGLGRRDVAGRDPLAQHEADFLVGDRRRLAAQRQSAQDQIGGRAEEPFERGAEPRHPAHEARQRGGDALGMDQREPLRHQLAEDRREDTRGRSPPPPC